MQHRKVACKGHNMSHCNPIVGSELAVWNSQHLHGASSLLGHSCISQSLQHLPEGGHLKPRDEETRCVQGGKNGNSSEGVAWLDLEPGVSNLVLDPVMSFLSS